MFAGQEATGLSPNHHSPWAGYDGSGQGLCESERAKRGNTETGTPSHVLQLQKDRYFKYVCGSKPAKHGLAAYEPNQFSPASTVAAAQ